MTPKEQIRKLLDRLPDDVSFEDIQYHLYVLQRIGRGLKELDEGRVIPHEDVVRRMSWGEGILRSAGGWAEYPEMDAVMDEIQWDRKRSP